VVLPAAIAEGALTGVFSSAPLHPVDGRIAVAQALADFPVNLLCFRPHQEPQP
jgi:(1->4)-alpha-D-glucan 1-alpha-D-glucosylmutase